MIPEEAVEATARAIFQSQTGMDWESRSDALKAEFITHAHAALEAAAPYMLAPGIRRPMEKGALFEELRRLNPSGALLKDIEALE